MSETKYEPKRGDFVEVVNRRDGWVGLRGIVTGATSGNCVTFHQIQFPDFQTPDGPATKAQFIASQLDLLVPAKPPRIPEPGLWGVVRAKGKGLAPTEWVNAGKFWRSIGGDPYPQVACWEVLVDPVLVREGVPE